MDDEKNVLRTFVKSGHDVRLESAPQVELPFQTLQLPVVSRQKFTSVIWPPQSIPEKSCILVSMAVGEFIAANPRASDQYWVFGPDTGPGGVMRDQRGQICGTKRLVFYSAPFGNEYSCPICAIWQPDSGYCRGCGQHLNEDWLHIAGTHLFFRNNKLIRTPVSITLPPDDAKKQVEPEAKKLRTSPPQEGDPEK
jgi:hypothetical protein